MALTGIRTHLFDITEVYSHAEVFTIGDTDVNKPEKWHKKRACHQFTASQFM